MPKPTSEGYPFNPDWVTCPGETLAEWFLWSKLPRSVAGMYGIEDETLARLLTGDEPITEDLARQLMHLTHVGAPFWLNLDHNYRAGLAAGLKHEHGDSDGA